MRTNDAETVIKGNSLIEPDDSIEVQVVSWLIQHQQCGLHKERPRKLGSKVQGQREEDPCLENPKEGSGQVQPETMNTLSQSLLREVPVQNSS